MNGIDRYPTIYVLCCLISNFEAFRLLFEALLLIKKLLIKKLGVRCNCESVMSASLNDKCAVLISTVMFSKTHCL